MRRHPLPDLTHLLGRRCELISNAAGTHWCVLRCGDKTVPLAFAVKISSALLPAGAKEANHIQQMIKAMFGKVR